MYEEKNLEPGIDDNETNELDSSGNPRELTKEKKKIEKKRYREQKELNSERKKMLFALNKAITDIYTMTSVVRSQIQILQDLQEVYQVSFRKKLERSVASTINIPVISKQKEQIRAAVRTIDVVIQGRKAFCAALDDLVQDFKKTNDTVISTALLSDLFFYLRTRNTNRYPL